MKSKKLILILASGLIMANYGQSIDQLLKKLATVQAEIPGSPRGRTDFNNLVTNLQQQFNKLAKDQQATSATLKQTEQARVQDQIVFKEQLAQQQALLANFSTQIKKHINQTAQQQGTITQLANQLQSIKTENLELKKTTDAQINILEQENINTKKTLSSSQDENSKLRTELEKTKIDSTAIQATFAKTKQDYGQQTTQLTEKLTEATKTLQDNKKFCETQKEEFLTTLDNITKEKEVLSQQYLQIEKLYKDINNTLNAAQTENAAYKKELEKTKIDSAAIQANLAKTKQNCNEQIQLLQNDLTKIQTEKKASDATYIDAFGKLKIAEQELDKAQKELEKTKATLTSTEQTRQKAVNDYNEAVALNQQATQAVKQAQEEKLDANKKATEKQKAYEDLDQKNKQLNDDYTNINQKYNQLQQSSKPLNAQIQALTERLAHNKAISENQAKNIETYTKELAENKTQLETYSTQLGTTKSALEKAQSNLEVSEQKNNLCQGVIAGLQTQRTTAIEAQKKAEEQTKASQADIESFKKNIVALLTQAVRLVPVPGVDKADYDTFAGKVWELDMYIRKNINPQHAVPGPEILSQLAGKNPDQQKEFWKTQK